MECGNLTALINRIPACQELDQGTRYRTDCLYPSSDPVFVYISKHGDGFRVTDGGGAYHSALEHGRDPSSADAIFEKVSKRHSLHTQKGLLIANPSHEDWLYPAITAVANASASAARMILEHEVRKADKKIKALIRIELEKFAPEKDISTDYEYVGRSGHSWKLDFAVRQEKILLIKSVTANGNSINSNYAAFGDIGDMQRS